MKRRIVASLIVVLGLLVALFASIAWVAPRTLTALAAPPTMTFNPNLLLVGSSGAAEPSIRTDKFGQSFVIGPTGVPSGCKAFRVSHDGSTSAFLGFPDHTAGGGDCDWALGPQETAATVTASDNDLAFSSLTLPNITVGKSDDGGKTFGVPNPAAAQVGGDDRMWMAADPKLNSLGFADIFMNYHDVSLGDIEVSISVDGGQTYAQSGPLINTSDVPQGQWEAAGGFAGNELGNIVARRPSGGALTLYAIFETPDSATDNASQGVAGTTNFNRVYEAVGTVSDATSPPTVSWRNYEIYHGPAGARLNRIFPITAVDDAGHVSAFWTDGNHIFYKTDTDGTGWNPATAPGELTNPTGVNTTVMPWAAAGANGIIDVVFYGASGGAGTQPNPQDDTNNQWNVYLAQTVDGGSSWGVFQASDHMIHKGPICIDGLSCNTSMPARDRTLLDFFQNSIDPTNGAADITYADDHASPGSAVLYFTRQCTGESATTGVALVDDCKAPPPPPTPPQGTTCPGPQIVDYTGDAPNNYPAGDGSNMANLDIVNAFFTTPDANNLKVTLTINDLEAPPPPANMVSGFWTVYWTYSGTTYFAQATSNGTGSDAVFNYTDGTYSGTTYTVVNSISGVATAGKNGTFVMTVPRADVGNPPDGASLTQLYADTHGSFTVAGNGEYFTADADRAPDSEYGASYGVAQVCPTPDTIGAYDPSKAVFYLRNSNSGGNADLAFAYGPANCMPLAGDWTGKGYDSVGVYCPSTGTFYLKNTNSGGKADIAFRFGPLNCKPLAGDWTKKGYDSVGVVCGNAYYLRNSNSAGNADVSFVYGPSSASCGPVAGDWTGKGFDSIGMYCPNVFYLRNSNSAGNADIAFAFGPSSGCQAVTGDWTDKGIDSVGVSCAGVYYLRNTNSAGNADIAFHFGAAGFLPIAGIWVAPESGASHR